MLQPVLRTFFVAFIAASVLLCGGGGVSTAAQADSVTDRNNALDQQIAQLKDTLEGASADMVAAAVTLKRSEVGLVDARAASAAAQKALAAAQARDAELESQLAFSQAQQAKAMRELGTQQAAEAATRSALGQIARETYLGNEFSGLAVALQSQSPDQFADRLAIADAALRSRSGAIDRLSVEQADLRARGAKLAAVDADVTELKRQSALVVVQRQNAQQAATAAQAAVEMLVHQQAAALALIQTKVAAEKARVDALQNEQAKLKAILVARARAAAAAAAERRRRAAQGSAGGDGGQPPAASSGFLSYAANGPLTSGYGMRYHPILHIWRMHTGVDFGIPCGTPVYAAADGSVISAGGAGGYGNRVVIDHGLVNGVDLATTYNHLSQIVVSGGAVHRGQLIAYSGTTGLSTGCHLHFETLVNGDFVDPMRYL